MVSNSLNMELQDLLETLERVQRECGTDPEYQELPGACRKSGPCNGCRRWRHTTSARSPSTNGQGRSGIDVPGPSHQGRQTQCPVRW